MLVLMSTAGQMPPMRFYCILQAFMLTQMSAELEGPETKEASICLSPSSSQQQSASRQHPSFTYIVSEACLAASACSQRSGVSCFACVLQLTAKEYGGGHESPVGSDNEDDEGITRAPPPGFRGAGEVTMAKPDVVRLLPRLLFFVKGFG